MESLYRQEYALHDIYLDCFGRLKPSALLYFVQETAGRHCELLGLDWNTLARKELFWAVTRHMVQITRLPESGETITVETWPMPTTRVAFPRATAAYDKEGRELFRVISLWVLMNRQTRALVLPGKSGIDVPGILRGGELPVPGSLAPGMWEDIHLRNVCFTDLDKNGHMNNTRYLDWIMDLLPADFHQAHPVKEFTLCYLSEARETQQLGLGWKRTPEDTVLVDAHRQRTDEDSGNTRVFAAKLQF